MSIIAAVRQLGPDIGFGNRAIRPVGRPGDVTGAGRFSNPLGEGSRPNNVNAPTVTDLDTAGKRSNAVVQLNIVVPMRGALARAQTKDLHNGALAFVWNDTTLHNLHIKNRTEQLTRLASYSFLDEPAGDTQSLLPYVDSADDIKKARGYIKKPRMVEALTRYQEIKTSVLTKNIQISSTAIDEVKWNIKTRSTETLLKFHSASPFLLPLSAFGIKKEEDAKYLGMSTDINIPQKLQAKLAAQQAYGLSTRSTDTAELEAEPLRKELFSTDGTYSGSDGCVGKIGDLRPHGAVIYKYSTETDAKMEHELDAMHNAMFNIAVQGMAIVSDFAYDPAKAYRIYQTRQSQMRLASLPRDNYYIVIVGRYNLMGIGQLADVTSIDQLHFELTTDADMQRNLRNRLHPDHGGFLEADEFILGAWRIGSAVDVAATRLKNTKGSISVRDRSTFTSMLALGIKWLSSVQLHRMFFEAGNEEKPDRANSLFYNELDVWGHFTRLEKTVENLPKPDNATLKKTFEDKIAALKNKLESIKNSDKQTAVNASTIKPMASTDRKRKRYDENDMNAFDALVKTLISAF